MLRETKYTKPKIIVLGYARHGKDSVCELLARHGYTLKSSSLFACEKVVYPALKDKYGYESIEACYQDRVNHRKEWFDLIAQYNTPDLTKLGAALFREYDIYCGLRNINEFIALKNSGINIVTIWVDASCRLPAEDAESCTVTSDLADIIVDNNESYNALRVSVELCLLEMLGKTNPNDNS